MDSLITERTKGIFYQITVLDRRLFSYTYTTATLYSDDEDETMKKLKRVLFQSTYNFKTVR